MFTSNAALELAEELAERERQTGIEAASQALSGVGTIECIGCGHEIPKARRKAAPWANRCAECQTEHEQEQATR